MAARRKPGRSAPRRPRRASLARVLSYQNEDVLHRFRKLYDVTPAEAEELFTEVKKWLWLNNLPRAVSIPVTSPMHMMDEMWHNFILLTRDYEHFCREYLGRFLHHGPTRKQDMDKHRQDPAGAQRAFDKSLRAAMAFTFDNLGEETLWKWHVYLPARYGPAFLAQKTKAPQLRVPDADRFAADATLVPRGMARRARAVKSGVAARGYRTVRGDAEPDTFRLLSFLMGDVEREDDARSPDATQADPAVGPLVGILCVGQHSARCLIELQSTTRSTAAAKRVTLNGGDILFFDSRRFRPRLAPSGTAVIKRIWVRERASQSDAARLR